MAKSGTKEKSNWFYIVTGICLIAVNFINSRNQITPTDLTYIDVTANTSIKNIQSRSSRKAYRFYTLEYPAPFIINTYGGMAGGWSLEDKVNKGDHLQVGVISNSVQDLDDKKDIQIYSLTANQKLIFNTDGYNNSKNDYYRRVNTIALILGTLLFLRGTLLISSSTASVLGVISGGIIIMLRIMDRW